MGRHRIPVDQRFWSFIVKTDTCWLWAGYIQSSGYGQIRIANRPTLVHRLSWTLHNGPIPKGLLVLHHCDVRHCVNPAHLYLGTAKDNARDTTARNRRRPAGSIRPHTRARKLTDEQVRAIRQDDRGAHVVANQHGISEGTVYNIRARRRKALVPD